jgi:putative transposase
MALLFIEVLRSLMRRRTLTVHDFVVMPNHVHILMTLPPKLTLERAMRRIKGGYSFRAKKDLGSAGDVWQRGYSDVLVKDEDGFKEHERYIHDNPVKDGLSRRTGEFPFGSMFLKMRKSARKAVH